MTKMFVLGMCLVFVSGVSASDLNDLEPLVPFAATGVFVQGVECVLFQTSPGILYLTSEQCPVGEEAYIEGDFYSCISICMQEVGCVDVTFLSGCTVPEKKLSWGYVKAIYRSGN